jgi:hypothetical protein
MTYTTYNHISMIRRASLSIHLDELLLLALGSTIALYDGLFWLLPHFELLSLSATLGICFGGGLSLGIYLARNSR